MFRLDTQTNSIQPIEKRTFGSLSYGERTHLQEWVANSPECLGEELLIIQKEFAGFDETKERLDLLALDKSGHLVIIENKLDDSGRDVVWQALKYASYCSTLTRARVVDIYRSYLQDCGIEEDPEALLADFLEVDDISETPLNRGSDQRIILISANFRREVTATVLWLLQRQLDVKCIRATPYKLGDEVLLNFEQIIPVPEAEDFMVHSSEKEAEQTATSDADSARYRIRRAFWTDCLAALHRSDISLYDNISPSRDHWLSAATGVRACAYALIFAKKEVRVEINLGRAERAENKAVFDGLHARKLQIEESFGQPLDWKRLDHRKSSRIEFAKEFDSYNRDNWPNIIDWMVETLGQFHQAISEALHGVAGEVLD
ncbi:DUF4268 domain-containing protein [Erythrobacter rubeus]|uniref:DUF4268 domain-containing protein n=1 Tax=Erythrobacter rubeus TaxID=2760803 RepID=A0ABR8KRX9_9SPHN|nr:DUF4268 domain-containing protein [Erythrobacter rubeus]MBD2843475.1 DUF4268 domain-containing protein [Erythrobacter rubeus]